MTKSPLKLVPPAIVKRTVTTPGRKPNSVYRTREHLTGAEVDRLIDAAKANRWGHRDGTMILVAFRHGLQIVRTSGPALGSDGFRPCRPARTQGQERHAEYPSHPWRRDAGPAQVAAGAGTEVAVRVHSREELAILYRRLCAHDGARWCRGQAGLQAHPHMLRHACGFALANKGHDTRALQAYLGHRNIQHTVRYTELSPGRFKDFWR